MFVQTSGVRARNLAPPCSTLGTEALTSDAAIGTSWRPRHTHVQTCRMMESLTLVEWWDATEWWIGGLAPWWDGRTAELWNVGNDGRVE